MRIRSIKPEVHTDEDLWDLESACALPVFRAFTGLWGACDREGRFEWKPRTLKAAILPYWEGDFSRVLDALVTRGFVVKYACSGRQFGWVRTFAKHQVVNNKEVPSVLPEPPPYVPVTADYSTREPRVSHASPSALVPELVERNGLGTERIGNGLGTEIARGVPSLALSPAPSPAQGEIPEDRTRRPAAPRKDPLAHQIVTAATWDAYRTAYEARYGEPPIRNARVNGQITHFVGRIPHADAPHVAAHYCTSENARYVAAGHAWGPLLQDAEKLRTEWVTGRSGTAHAARQADKRAGRGAEYEEMFARLKAEERAV